MQVPNILIRTDSLIGRNFYLRKDNQSYLIMDSQEYAKLYRYLHEKQFPEDRNQVQYEDYASKFKLENSMIFLKDSEKKVVQSHEVE